MQIVAIQNQDLTDSNHQNTARQQLNTKCPTCQVHVGMTTTLRNFISQDNLQSQKLLNSGWSSGNKISTGPPL